MYHFGVIRERLLPHYPTTEGLILLHTGIGGWWYKHHEYHSLVPYRVQSTESSVLRASLRSLSALLTPRKHISISNYQELLLFWLLLLLLLLFLKLCFFVFRTSTDWGSSTHTFQTYIHSYIHTYCWVWRNYAWPWAFCLWERVTSTLIRPLAFPRRWTYSHCYYNHHQTLRLETGDWRLPWVYYSVRCFPGWLNPWFWDRIERWRTAYLEILTSRNTRSIINLRAKCLSAPDNSIDSKSDNQPGNSNRTWASLCSLCTVYPVCMYQLRTARSFSSPAQSPVTSQPSAPSVQCILWYCVRCFSVIYFSTCL